MIYTLKRWFYNFKFIVADFVTGVGLFWLFVEMASYSTSGSIDANLKSIWLFSIASAIILVISLLKNNPKTSFIYSEASIIDSFESGKINGDILFAG